MTRFKKPLVVLSDERLDKKLIEIFKSGDL